MRRMLVKCSALLLFLLSSFAYSAAVGDENPKAAQTVWQLLDYIAVDYSNAVSDGEIISEPEYAEMVEFANAAATRLANLPPTGAQPNLVHQAETLRAAINAKASVDEVAEISRALADALLSAYPVTLAPERAPNLARGKTLFAEECASCHGKSGGGDGPAAQNMEPPPIDFTDKGRARERSLFALDQVIEQGVDGTAMASYDWLSPEDRWALAFHVGSLAFSDNEARDGQRAWEDDQSLRSTLPDLVSLARVTSADLAESLGQDEANALLAYLRRHPEAVQPSASGLLTLAKSRLAESRQAYMAGDHQHATNLALSAYLDGFEPVEPALAVKDASLMREIEAAMIELRTLIGDDAPATEIETQLQTVSTLLDQAEVVLGADTTGSGAIFVGAFTILLREGLEALLIVVAMVAFLQKAERPEVLRYVHAGWLAALAAGVLTWAAANSLITISGAGRELTEGIGALTAALVLVTVGVWMHGKSQAGAWQNYIKEKVSVALSSQSAWFLFLLAFIAVYREVFETILFFIALWSQGQVLAMLAGAGLGIVVLGVIAWLLLNYSRRLPIGQFFLYSSFLIVVLAVILVGKGISALQEAGWFGISPVTWLPRVEIVGFYPTWEGIAGQVLTLGVLLAAFWYNHKKSAVAAP